MVDLSKFTYNKKILSKVVAKAINLLNKINITTYFENLIVELHALYALNIHVKFCVNCVENSSRRNRDQHTLSNG